MFGHVYLSTYVKSDGHRPSLFTAAAVAARINFGQADGRPRTAQADSAHGTRQAMG